MSSSVGLNGQGDGGELERAQGKLVVFLASLLQRAGVVRVEEFASLLSVFAETVSEEEPREGVILAGWAKTLQGLDVK